MELSTIFSSTMENICGLIDNLCKLKCFTNNEKIEIIKVCQVVCDRIFLYNNKHLKKISESPLLLQKLAEPLIQENLQDEAENTILFQKQTQARNKLQDIQYITQRIKKEFINIF